MAAFHIFSNNNNNDNNDNNNDHPPFYDSLHVQYIQNLAAKLDASFEGAITEHLRMSGIYWSLTALHILTTTPTQVDKLMNVSESIIDFVFECFDEKSGGFGGNVQQDGHLLYTLSAVQILALSERLDDERLQTHRIVDFVAHLQQPDGSFAGDTWGEIDTRFTYCALSTLSILGQLHKVQVRQAAEYVIQCRNPLDGGFGCVVGAESHAGQVFCCVGALAIANSLDLLI